MSVQCLRDTANRKYYELDGIKPTTKISELKDALEKKFSLKKNSYELSYRLPNFYANPKDPNGPKTESTHPDAGTTVTLQDDKTMKDYDLPRYSSNIDVVQRS
eukprot:TRINITY_DN926_c0_g1_i1.p1 TRINITY_DN926_c0_g1~~TRINITY_DN926_c0_g1_i1.p1  ORF type:complete len:103 (-),score=25.10 TRINITY_DN926_c0_g1_i1:77-385(-)